MTPAKGVLTPAVRGWIWIAFIALWLGGLAIDRNWHALVGIVGVAGAVYAFTDGHSGP